MEKSAERIIEEDIQTIYLGNLNTVEFDLQLPLKGNNGSDIEWFSDNELFLKSNGSVTRPMNGVGDRKVNLHAIFHYGGRKKEEVYEVHILEEKSKIEIVEVLPLERTIPSGVVVALPQAVVVKADNDHFFSKRVEWKGGNEQIFNQCGEYILAGKVLNEKLPAELILHVEEGAESEKKDTTPVITPMDEGEVELKPGSPFFDNRERDLIYLKKISADQMLYNFRVEAGLDTLGAEEMIGWDSPKCLLRGHTTGHYMSALALCYRETHDHEIKEKLHYIVRELAECQEVFSRKPEYQEGYIGAYSEKQYDELEEEAKYPDVWAPYYTLHKILAGLLDAYHYIGDEIALEVAKKAGMWIYNRLSRLNKEQRENMWDTYIAGEFGGINETLVKLYEITGKEEYLTTAKMFDNDKLFIPMEESKDVLESMHVNQHVPQMIGAMELFEAEGEKRYYDIAEYFWKAVTDSHIFVNGGAGENEMFFEPYIYEKYLTEENTEYCVSYNMLKLTKQLYRFNPKTFYMDYYERVMFNHLVAGFDHDITGETNYFYPLKPGTAKLIKPQNTCCHGTGMESQMKYTEAIYFSKEEEIYINLFLNSKVNWKEKGITITQSVKRSEPGTIILCIEGRTEFKLKIRCPYWCDGYYDIMGNNGKIIAKCDADGYINIDRRSTDDEIQVQFACEMRVETLDEGSDIAALAYGPYILAALSNKEGFLEYHNLMNRIEKAEGDELEFFTREEQIVRWLPLYRVDKEKHHVYWKNIR